MMCNRILMIVAVVIALALAIMAVTLHGAGLTVVVLISRFFEVMIPVLAVAALLKYLCKDCCSSS